jgi:hypothetical protein
LIDEHMGKLENKRDLSPYRALKTRLPLPTRGSCARVPVCARAGRSHCLRHCLRVRLPVRTKFDELPAHPMPRSSSAHFQREMWQKPVGD